VIGVSVDGAKTAAGIDTHADGEVQLDIDVIGAIAPGATVVVYFAPNSSRGFVDALTTAIHDPEHRPCAISISWGMMEEAWSQQTREAMDEAFQDAGLLGITVCAASGDDGSTDNHPQAAPHTDYPASSPWVLGCGGTLLRDQDGSIAEETWDDRAMGGGSTGGGISAIYPVPTWQASANSLGRAGDGSPGRGVPDVAGDASPRTGYRVRVNGKQETIGGTSAVAPLWAALVARMTESMGTSIGFLNPLLYTQAAMASMHDITSGSNGDYTATAGWDACTGLGTPDGEALQGALATIASSGREARLS
jgi:kumamolisin